MLNTMNLSFQNESEIVFFFQEGRKEGKGNERKQKKERGKEEGKAGEKNFTSTI